MSTQVTAPTAFAETHSATVFFIGDRAYKLKKPVDLGFLDFSTRERRLDACQREVELNRRLAPDVYLGVADVLGPDGQPCDHLVVMRRMPEERRLSTLLAKGQGREHLSDIARRIAVLHAHAASSAESPAIAQVGTARVLRDNWDDNFSTMRPFVGTILPAEEFAACEHLAHRHLDGRERLFEERIRDGHVRDGHGDLLAQDIFCLDDGPRILDCLEFSDRYRFGDVLLDVGFLAMDLERLGFPAEADEFLRRYVEFTGETHPDSLAHLFIAYRAHVRAKVACIRSAQGDREASGEAVRLHAMVLDHLRRGRIVLALVGGLPGTGKSTLAAGLSAGEGWALFRSDEIRKDLAGLGHTDPAPAAFGEGLYTEQGRQRAYDELLRRARMLLERGVSVVLDASWSSEAQRRQALDLAAATSSDVVELRCEVPAEVAAARVASRRSDPSDATGSIAQQMARFADAWPQADAITTDRPIDAVLATARRQMAAQLAEQETGGR